MVNSCLPVFTSICSFSIKVVNLMKGKEYYQLYCDIKFDWQFWTSKEEQLIILKHANYARLFTLLCSGGVTATIFFFLSPSFIPQILDIVYPLNETRSKTLSLEVYFFVNSEDYFYFIFFHIAINLICQFFIFVGFESSFAIVIEHGCALFEIIGFQLKKINNNDNERENLEKLFFCIEQHKRAIKFCNNVESIYVTCFFFVMSINAFIISVCLTEFVLHLDNLKMSIQFGWACTSSLIYVLLNSFFAQRLIDYSTELPTIIYDSSWYQKSVKIKKILLFMMMRSEIPCKITAGKIIDISLKSVCAILQTCFSYFTLMLSTTNY
ncbi:odorant receptor 13a-like [Leptopilina boulardi]|uniref:odorant receptor 13a-like n=1 Tax=Leptopilina boulardi TaxID=63433 RepID=UPI0021F55782|nr:odorant receptor 13a-like [Leptopilina boulardi]